MQFINTLKLIISLLPLIIQAVQTIEASFPAGGNGDKKLAAVKALLQSVYATSTDTVAQFEQIWPAIQGTVTAVVGLFNSTGLFQSQKQ